MSITIRKQFALLPHALLGLALGVDELALAVPLPVLEHAYVVVAEQVEDAAVPV